MSVDRVALFSDLVLIWRNFSLLEKSFLNNQIDLWDYNSQRKTLAEEMDRLMLVDSALIDDWRILEAAGHTPFTYFEALMTPPKVGWQHEGF